MINLREKTRGGRESSSRTIVRNKETKMLGVAVGRKGSGTHLVALGVVQVVVLDVPTGRRQSRECNWMVRREAPEGGKGGWRGRREEERGNGRGGGGGKWEGDKAVAL